MKQIKLFDYQEDMKERIEKALRLHRSVMVQMPTGTGKTVLLASVVEAFLREYPESSVWIVAYRRELVSQIKETLNKFLLNFNFSKTHPSSLTLKRGDFSKHPVPLSNEGNLPTTPSLLHKEGSTFSPSPSSSGSGDVAGDAIALPEFSYRQRSLCISSAAFGNLKASFHCTHLHELCPQGADDDSSTQQSYHDDFRLHSAKDKQAYHCSRLHENCDCLCGINRLADNSTPIQVLVNVDIFSEGFDCPDVEFVQLARPTLSLAKYLQMVGRGLRVAKGKKNCVIIDNVGLYRVFGLPSQIRGKRYECASCGECRGCGICEIPPKFANKDEICIDH